MTSLVQHELVFLSQITPNIQKLFKHVRLPNLIMNPAYNRKRICSFAIREGVPNIVKREDCFKQCARSVQLSLPSYLYFPKAELM